MGTNGMLESLELNLADVPQRQGLSDAQFGDRIRHQDLFGLGMGAQPGCQLDRRAEEIVVPFDGLAGRKSDPQLE